MGEDETFSPAAVVGAPTLPPPPCCEASSVAVAGASLVSLPSFGFGAVDVVVVVR